MSKFFTFDQNNSGGFFKENNNIAKYVIIEANNYSEANGIAQEIGIYFDGRSTGEDCDCCGDRWDKVYEEEGTETPTIYSQDARDFIQKSTSVIFNKKCIIHYLNGKIEAIEKE